MAAEAGIDAADDISALGAAEGVQSFLLLWIGDGVGAGVVLGGRLLRGTTGAAGEIGGILVPVDGAIAGATSGDGFATLEEALSLTAIDALRRRHGIAGVDTPATSTPASSANSPRSSAPSRIASRRQAPGRRLAELQRGDAEDLVER